MRKMCQKPELLLLPLPPNPSIYQPPRCGRMEGDDGGETNNIYATECVKGLNESRVSTQEMCPFPLQDALRPCLPGPSPVPGRLKKCLNAIAHGEARV